MLYYHPISKNIAYALSVVFKEISSKLAMFFTNVISDSKTMSGIKSLINRSYRNLFNYKVKIARPLVLDYITTEGTNPIVTDIQRNKYTKY